MTGWIQQNEMFKNLQIMAAKIKKQSMFLILQIKKAAKVEELVKAKLLWIIF